MRGFTMVELMVTLVITSILVLGAGGFLQAAHQSNIVQTAVSGLNSNGRFGLSQIARDIRMSGYRDSDWQLGGIAQPIMAETFGDAEGGDTLQLRYEGDRDCAFAPPPAGATTVTNLYRVSDNDRTLLCNGQVIASGVEQMRVYFGRDTDNDNVPNAWIRAGNAFDMTQVVAVRIHLLTVTQGVDVAVGEAGYYFDSQTQQGGDDGQIRREYSMTVATRNVY